MSQSRILKYKKTENTQQCSRQIDEDLFRIRISVNRASITGEFGRIIPGGLREGFR